MVSNNSTALNSALAYADRGWPVFPVQPPPNKKPVTANGFLDATTDHTQIIAWWSKWPSAQVGVACGDAHIIAVDLDEKPKECISGRASLETIGIDPDAGSSLIMRTPRNNGLQLLFSGSNTARKLGVIPGVDLLGDGGYTIVPSPASPGREWMVGDHLDPDDLEPMPEWVADLLEGVRSPGDTEKVVVSGQSFDPIELADIVSALAQIDPDDRATWIKIGMALKSTGCGEEAYAVWCDWSEGSPKFDAREQRYQWDRLYSNRDDGRAVEIESIYYLANQQARKQQGPTCFEENDESSVWDGIPLEWFDVPPPPRDYLLRHPTLNGGDCPPGHGDGFLIRGKAGTMSSAGGVGKTIAMIQLALSVATGNSWLGHFHTSSKGGRVLMLLGEEDPDEARRRFFFVAQDLGIDQDEIRAAMAAIVVMPLAGIPCPLLRAGKDDDVETTKDLEQLHEHLEAHAGDDGWALIVMDPQARFAGVDAESSNPIATRFVQECERLTTAPGSPTVLVVAHSSKLARRMGSADSRGVTALTDGFRWHATLSSQGNGVELKVEKNNYARPCDPLRLERGDNGLLTVESDGARERREKAMAENADEREAEKDAARNAKGHDRMMMVLQFLNDSSTVQNNKEGLGRASGIGKKSSATEAVNLALALGLIEKTESSGFALTEKGKRELAEVGDA